MKRFPSAQTPSSAQPAPAATASSMLMVYLVLTLGVLSVSSSATMIRFAEAPALVIGAARMALAALLLTPMTLWRHWAELRRMPRRDWGWALLSGVFLGVHFASWITSLQYTTVASSVVLVATNPLFVALFGHFILGERLPAVMWYGMLFSVMGAALIGYGDIGLSPQALWGDLLALVGAVSGAAYLLCGRHLRQRYSLLAYVFPTYWMAAAVLGLAMWVSGASVIGYAPGTYLIFLLLAIGPQILGHTSLNWALGHLSTTAVAVAALGEPVVSTLLAFMFLAEAPTAIKTIGGMLVLAGIVLSMRGEKVRKYDND